MAQRIDMDPRALLASRARKTKPAKRYGLTPRIKAAIRFIVFGDDAGTLPASIAEAAKMAKITPRSLNDALTKPSVVEHYRQQVKLLRDGHRPANIRALVDIRDDPTLKSSAAGARARTHAISVLQSDPDERSGLSVNVGIGLSVDVDQRPGYVIDLSAHPSQPLTIDHDPAGQSDRVEVDDDDQYEGAAAPRLEPAGRLGGGGGEKSRSPSTVVSPARALPLDETPVENIPPPPAYTGRISPTGEYLDDNRAREPHLKWLDPQPKHEPEPPRKMGPYGWIPSFTDRLVVDRMKREESNKPKTRRHGPKKDVGY